eukprot:6326806-Alexandrium_andersonii.AAC.1
MERGPPVAEMSSAWSGGAKPDLIRRNGRRLAVRVELSLLALARTGERALELGVSKVHAVAVGLRALAPAKAGAADVLSEKHRRPLGAQDLKGVPHAVGVAEAQEVLLVEDALCGAGELLGEPKPEGRQVIGVTGALAGAQLEVV